MRLPKIGDRVKITCNSFSLCKKGETGTVVEIDEELETLGVRFDKYRYSRHTCGGLCDDGHGRWIPLEFFMHEEIRVIPRNNLLA